MVVQPRHHSVADAVVKKIPGVDPERALNAMLVTAADTARGGGLAPSATGSFPATPSPKP